MKGKEIDRRTRDAWGKMWRIERDPAPGITLAVPLRIQAMEIRPARPNPAVVARGLHKVTWIGVSPELGLVQATANWTTDGPLGTAVPPLPDGEWTRCDKADFGYMSKDRGIDGKPLGEFGSYTALPLSVRSQRIDHVEASVMIGSESRHLLYDFVMEIGLPRASLGPMLNQPFSDYAFQQACLAQYRPTMPLVGLHWLLGTDAAEGIPASLASERRCQAVAALPLYAHQVIHDVYLSDVVDRGRELMPEIATRMSMSQGTLKTLNKAAMRGGDTLFQAVYSLLHRQGVKGVLEAIPPDVLRSMADGMGVNGWRSLGNLIGEFESPVERRLFERMAASLRADPGGGWGWLEGSQDVWGHLRDVARDLGDELVWPAEVRGNRRAALQGYRSTMSDVAALSLLTSIPPRRLARIVDEHLQGHLRRAREIRDAATAAPRPGWEPLAEPVVMGGRTMRFLANHEELDHEGSAMGHCVASYASSCQQGRCAILSIGDWKREVWHPSSTVEIVRAADGSLGVAQHRGPGNSAPSQADVGALQAWRQAERAGEIPCQGELLNTGKADTIAVRLGMEWDTPEAHDARWDRWRRILDVRHRSAGGFAEAALADLVANPEQEGSRLHQVTIRLCSWLNDMDEEMRITREIREMEALAAPVS